MGRPASIGRWLLALLGAIGLSLLAAHPSAAQDGVHAIDTPNLDNEIVYIDDDGFIRVFDPQTPPYLPPVNFRSPDGDWFDATVADLNGDGDDEIIAIAQDRRLTVYDPVINTTDIVPGQQYDGLYWEELFAIQLPGEPLLVATGEFDDNPVTRDIVVVLVDPDRPTASRIQIWVQPAPPFNGKNWEALTDVRLGAIATDIATGDLDGDGRDELAIVARSVGRLSVFRRAANNALVEFWSASSLSRPWSGVAIGNVASEWPLPELIAVRSAAPPLASLVVQRYIPVDQFEDVLLRDHLPAPRSVFLADVTGIGTPQIFMLRDVPEADTRPRLFNSRTGSGAGFAFEVRLDNDNGYRAAAAGDVDGDGKDEIAVIRDTGIGIFLEPATSTTMTPTLTAPTNRRTIAIGNLDTLGSDFLINSRSSLTFSVPSGVQSESQTISLTNRTRTNPVQFFVETAPPVSFVNAVQASGATPGDVVVTVDATDLLPISELTDLEASLMLAAPAAGVFTPTYGANLVMKSTNPLVLNSPLTVPVFIEVTPGIVMRPNRISIPLLATSDPPDCQASLPLTMTVRVLGTAGSEFSVSSNAEWLSVAPREGGVTAGETTILTLTVGYGDLPSPVAEAEIVLSATDVPGVPDGAQLPMTRRVPVTIACFPNWLYLPIIER
ncbi:MAG: hypothetical protein R6W76_14750 [Caldilinea sp.]